MIRLRSGRKFNQRGYTFNELLVAMAIWCGVRDECVR